MSRQSKKIEKNCLICNKIFIIFSSRIKRGEGKFCSIKCKGIYKTHISNSPEYFWSNIDMRANINLCWEWKKHKSNRGYGKILYNGKYVRSHRLAYFLTFPEQDIEENQKLLVCHKCDNPSCCNPNHLFLGTNKDNMDDMIQKRRDNKAKGSNNGNAKLDEFDVKQILLLKGMLQIQTVAEMYKVDYQTIYDIFNNKTWKHIERNR